MIGIAHSLAVTSDFGSDRWVFVFAPLVVYCLISLGLFVMGAATSEGEGGARFFYGETNLLKFFFRSISSALTRLTGYPGWAMAGVLSGLTVLGVALFGLYWDVAWHIDLGRDRSLFTPPHTMIVLGLGGLIYSAVIAVIFATVDGAKVGRRFLGMQVPWSALALAALGLGGLVAFPLDNLWHQAYGLDVTLWSPTHLQLVAGGSFATIALWLMIAESRPGERTRRLGRGIHALAAGATLVAMSTFQGEFDYGVPQFQALYLPLLIAVAAGFTLVAARAILGPWGALKAVAGFLILRGALALFVAGTLSHTLPRFPLYLVSALCVEGVAVAMGTVRRVRFALVSGLAIGTLGIAGEVIWMNVSGWFETTPALLLKTAALAPAAAVAAAMVGVALTRAFAPGPPVPRRFLVLAGVALIAVMAYPLPRNVGQVVAMVRLHNIGDTASVEVRLSPPDAAAGATAFGVVAWQGGGVVRAALREQSPGVFVSSQDLPITGAWKTVIGLQRGDEVMATAIHMPSDSQIGAAAVAAVPERTVTFEQNTKVLLREVHDGPAWPALLAYTGFALVALTWLALLGLVVIRAREGPPGSTGRPAAPRVQPVTAS